MKTWVSLVPLLLISCSLWNLTIGSKHPILLFPGFFTNQIEAATEQLFPDGSDLHHMAHHDMHEECVDGQECGSSHVCGNTDWHSVWLAFDQLMPETIDCWIYKMKMMFRHGSYVNNKGVKVRVPGFGGTDTVEYADPSSYIPYMNQIVEFFTNNSYVKGASIRGAPYDWRLTPDLLMKTGYYEDVKQLIETMYKENDNSAVAIISHCMGSPIVLYFLTNVVNQQWKDQHIKAFVSLAGAWKGTLPNLGNIISGDNFGLPNVDALKMRSVQRMMPASYFVIPTDEEIWSQDEILVETPTKNYTLQDYEELFTDMGYPQGYDQYKANPSFLTALPPPNTPVYCYSGTEVDTPIRLVYKHGEFPDSQPTTVMGSGDGIVKDASLEACAVWKRLQNQPVEIRRFPGIPHMLKGILSSPLVFQAVLEVVNN